MSYFCWLSAPRTSEHYADLSKQLMHMDMIDSSMNEAIDSTLGDSEELEEATDLEVTKVINELTADISAKVPSVASRICLNDRICGRSTTGRLASSVEQTSRMNDYKLNCALIMSFI
ncbi:hypothetical protein AHF37_12273 [Paragonimus kellicotti]|nr:hypothetical protein AHF37_12273 [Paragonimus kellicotti]